MAYLYLSFHTVLVISSIVYSFFWYFSARNSVYFKTPIFSMENDNRCDTLNPRVFVDNSSTRGKSIRLVSRDHTRVKIASWAHEPILIKIYTQLYSNSSRVITFLLIQTHIKIYIFNTCYPKNIKPQPSFLQNLPLR